MVLRVEQYGVQARCRECGALNPNPDKLMCWHCGKDGLCCPNPSHRRSASILRYDILGDFWKCWNTACRTKYTWCKECGHATLEQLPKGLWACTNCHASGSSPENVVKINLDVFNRANRYEETEQPPPEIKIEEPKASGIIAQPSMCPKCMSNESKWNSYGSFWECSKCGYIFGKQNGNATEPQPNAQTNGSSGGSVIPNAQQNSKRRNISLLAGSLSVVVLIGILIGITHASRHGSVSNVVTTNTASISTSTFPVESLLSVNVTPNPIGNFPVGASQQFMAMGIYQNNSTSNITPQVTWVSSNPLVATINSAGVATCITPGTTDIKATNGSITSPPVSLTVMSVSSITVSPTSPSVLIIGAAQQFSATGIYPDNSQAIISSPNGTTGNIAYAVTWASSNTRVVTINSAGLATALTAGSTNITASMSGIISAPVFLHVTPSTYTLSVRAAGGTVSMNGAAVTGNTPIAAGQNIVLTATPPTDYFFTGWSGDASGNTNPLTITMNSDKNITAIFVAENPETPVTLTGTFGPAASGTEGENKISIEKTIQLTQGEWISGTVSGSTTNHDSFKVTDPSGTVLYQTPTSMGVSLGGNGTFTFRAQITGTYTVTFTTGEVYAWSYNLTYTIYAPP